MKRLFLSLSICLLTISCSSKIEPRAVEKQLLPMPKTPEVVANPFEIYNSMARAVKYNINKAILDNDALLLKAETLASAKEKLALFNVDEKSYDIYCAYKKLSAAIAIKSNSHYQNLAQNLMLAGVNVYGKGHFSKNESINLKRFATHKNKELDKLLGKQKGIEKLSATDEAHIEALEVFLLQAKKMQDKYAKNLEYLEALDKVNYQDVDFGSKKYFEMKQFRPEFSLPRFEAMAVEYGVIKDLSAATNILATKYRHAYRLDMTDNAFKNKPLKKEVIDEADAVSYALLEDNISMDAAKTLQIKLAYYIAKLTNFEYVEADNNLIEAQKNYNKITKNKKLFKEKLEAKAEVIKTEYDKNNALTNFAVAVQNLYFITQPLDINNKNLNVAVGRIGRDIRKYINANKTHILTVKAPINPREIKKMPLVNQPKNWAQDDTNWIEEIVEDTSGVITTEKPHGNQLGAFHVYKNAKTLMEANPGSAIYASELGGKTLYKVIAK